ncbi:beta-phosphoglucomutase [Candidatus Mycoplasma pogonae]
MIKGFIFDLDGVITETAHLHYLAWKNEVAKIGIDLTEEQNQTIKGLSREKTLEAILKMFDKTIDKNLFAKIAKDKNKAYKKMLKTEISSKNIFPGIKSFLIEAKTNGIKLALASSSHNASTILKKLRLYDYFDFIVNAKDVVEGKPNPEIFLRAAVGLKLDPSQCVGFEDAPAGLQAIKAAKMFAICVCDPENEKLFSGADLIFHNTKDFDFQKIINDFESNEQKSFF